MNRQIVQILLLLLAGLPLVIYPVLLIANVMSLAGYQSTSAGAMVTIVSLGFFFTSTIYPVVYITSIIGYFISSRKKSALWKRRFVIIPFVALAIQLVMLGLWVLVDSPDP